MRFSILTSKRAKALRRKLTEPEIMLWSRLKGRGPDQPKVRNHFFCPAARLAVEIDGATHGDEAQLAHDQRRDAWLRAQGIEVFRIPASSVFADLDTAADGVRTVARSRMKPAPG